MENNFESLIEDFRVALDSITGSGNIAIPQFWQTPVSSFISAPQFLQYILRLLSIKIVLYRFIFKSFKEENQYLSVFS